MSSYKKHSCKFLTALTRTRGTHLALGHLHVTKRSHAEESHVVEDVPLPQSGPFGSRFLSHGFHDFVVRFAQQFSLLQAILDPLHRKDPLAMSHALDVLQGVFGAISVRGPDDEVRYVLRKRAPETNRGTVHHRPT